MRELTKNESELMDDFASIYGTKNVEPIEATVSELYDLDIILPRKIDFSKLIPKYENKKIRCWLDKEKNKLVGSSFHIKLIDENIGNKIGKLTGSSFDGESQYLGFMRFVVD